MTRRQQIIAFLVIHGIFLYASLPVIHQLFDEHRPHRMIGGLALIVFVAVVQAAIIWMMGEEHARS